MNIAFWSNVAGKSATSGNMLAVSTMTSLLYSLKVVLMQVDYCSKSIESVLEGKHDEMVINDNFAYYNQKGMDDRYQRLEKAISYLESYLDVLQRCEILPKDEKQQYEGYLE